MVFPTFSQGIALCACASVGASAQSLRSVCLVTRRPNFRQECPWRHAPGFYQDFALCACTSCAPGARDSAMSSCVSHWAGPSKVLTGLGRGRCWRCMRALSICPNNPQTHSSCIQTLSPKPLKPSHTCAHAHACAPDTPTQLTAIASAAPSGATAVPGNGLPCPLPTSASPPSLAPGLPWPAPTF
jgi:hypothetical protein